MSRLAGERQNEDGSMTDHVDYQQDGVGIKVRLDAAHDTVWLRQEQMGELFGRERSVLPSICAISLPRVNWMRIQYVQILHILPKTEKSAGCARKSKSRKLI